jgi:DNA-binding CsgD family transcriptional regulator
MQQTYSLHQLTEREHEVLALVAAGKTNPEIARSLSISTLTARNHVSNLLNKLKLARRVEVIVWMAQINPKTD